MLLHSVYFYLKKDAPDDTAACMERDIIGQLSSIPQILELWAGAPEGIEREVVDNEYAMSLHAIFKDRETLRAYQEDPVHVEFVNTYKVWFERLRVYDTRLSEPE